MLIFHFFKLRYSKLLLKKKEELFSILLTSKARLEVFALATFDRAGLVVRVSAL